MTGRVAIATVVVAGLLVAPSCGRIGFEGSAGKGSDGGTRDGAGDGGGIDTPGPSDGSIDGPIVDGPGVRCTGNCTYGSDTIAYCDAPGCSLTCSSGATCQFSCTAPCTVSCAGGATCTSACTGGGCTLSVSGGAELTSTCTANCSLDCPFAAGVCQQTCDAPATCTCSGPNCS